MNKMVPLEEVKELIQKLMSYTFGGDPVEREVHNDAVKKANKQIQELIDKYEKE